jgi:RNA polymerase sigma factor (sigma-70 family)
VLEGFMKKKPTPTVFVVDDNPSIRDTLEELFQSVGMHVDSHESAASFLESFNSSSGGCLVLDVRLQGMDGLQLQQKLKRREIDIPIIFISGYADVPLAVQAIKNGAFDFLEKPFREQHLLDTVNRAIEKDEELRIRRLNREAVMGRMAKLTEREREVMELVLEGKTSKVIAAQLGRSQNTIDQHRAKILEKMKADNVASLVRMVLEVRDK